MRRERADHRVRRRLVATMAISLRLEAGRPKPLARPIHSGHRVAFAIVIVAIGLLILLAGRG
jgi:hypothetical protein